MTYLTIVYEIKQLNQVRDLLDMAPWAAFSHSHEIHDHDRAREQRDHATARRNELIVALRGVLDILPSTADDPAVRHARQALIKATGGKA